MFTCGKIAVREKWQKTSYWLVLGQWFYLYMIYRCIFTYTYTVYIVLNAHPRKPMISQFYVRDEQVITSQIGRIFVQFSLRAHQGACGLVISSCFQYFPICFRLVAHFVNQHWIYKETPTSRHSAEWSPMSALSNLWDWIGLKIEVST